MSWERTSAAPFHLMEDRKKGKKERVTWKCEKLPCISFYTSPPLTWILLHLSKFSGFASHPRASVVYRMLGQDK
jgi:hypothetical protein